MLRLASIIGAMTQNDMQSAVQQATTPKPTTPNISNQSDESSSEDESHFNSIAIKPGT